MIVTELFEYASPKPRHVWSKRGKGVEKRVDREPDTKVKGRSQLNVKKEQADGE